jgi:hypothetical protein
MPNLKGMNLQALTKLQVDEIPDRHQPTNGQGARPRNPANPPRPCRGDRIESRLLRCMSP